MECNPKIPGQIVPTPLFPDGRGEIIKVLLPFKECNVESNYLNGLIKSTIKKNQPKIDCKKPQKSEKRENNANPRDPNSINNFPPGKVIEFPPGTSPIVPNIPGRSNNVKIYPQEQLNWYLCRHEVNIPDILLENSGGSRINYYWVWMLYGEPPIRIDKDIIPKDFYPGNPNAISSSWGYWNSLFLSTNEIQERANNNTLEPYNSYRIYDSINYICYEQIYAQGRASAYCVHPSLRDKDLTYFGTNDLTIKNLGLTIEEIENLIVRRFPYIPEQGTVNYIFDAYTVLLLGYFDEISYIYYVISPTSGRRIWTGTAWGSMGVISSPLNNLLKSDRRWYVDDLPGYYGEETPDEETFNDGDNGMTNKDDCCCDCVEAIAAVMEAYMERISPMFDDLKQYINVKIKEQSEYLDKQLLQQSEFIQEQLLQFDDQQIDFTPVINQIKTTEQNLWTGANLSINSDELPKAENE